jgi:hypothetical protein
MSTRKPVDDNSPSRPASSDPQHHLTTASRAAVLLASTRGCLQCRRRSNGRPGYRDAWGRQSQEVEIRDRLRSLFAKTLKRLLNG